MKELDHTTFLYIHTDGNSLFCQHHYAKHDNIDEILTYLILQFSLIFSRIKTLDIYLIFKCQISYT